MKVTRTSSICDKKLTSLAHRGPSNKESLKECVLHLVHAVLVLITNPGLTIIRELYNVLCNKLVGVHATSGRQAAYLVTTAQIHGDVLVVTANFRRPRRLACKAQPHNCCRFFLVKGSMRQITNNVNKGKMKVRARRVSSTSTKRLIFSSHSEGVPQKSRSPALTLVLPSCSL